jgi:hypothetical protein
VNSGQPQTYTNRTSDLTKCADSLRHLPVFACSRQFTRERLFTRETLICTRETPSRHPIRSKLGDSGTFGPNWVTNERFTGVTRRFTGEEQKRDQRNENERMEDYRRTLIQVTPASIFCSSLTSTAWTSNPSAPMRSAVSGALVGRITLLPIQSTSPPVSSGAECTV